ncbi:MAG: PAS domain-containing sensor histidine kinase [Pseudomonadota bacterium]
MNASLDTSPEMSTLPDKQSHRHEKAADHSGRTADQAADGASRSTPGRINRLFGYFAMFAALASCLISFAVLLGYTRFEPTGEVVLMAVIINGCFALLLLGLIAREILRLVQAQRQGRAAARMHVRIVGLFGIVATVPALLVAIIAGVTLDRGLDRWFAERTRTIVDSSQEVARAYIRESARTLQGSTLSMAAELNRNASVFRLDPGGFQDILTRQARGRGMLGAALITGEGETIITAVIRTDEPNPLPKLAEETLAAAGDGDPKLISPGESNIVGAIIRLPQIPFAYLYTTRELDSIVRRSLTLMENNTTLYGQLSDSRLSVQFAFAVLYTSVTLILLLSAIWIGVNFADRLVAPIRQLIGAAQQVRGGNMNARVPVDSAEGDVAALSDTFNRMVSDIGTQRDEIVEARDTMDRRRRFTEAVLSGVTPGVLGVTGDGVVSISNLAAQSMLGHAGRSLVGRDVHELAPALAQVLDEARRSHRSSHMQQINIRRGGKERTWNVQVTDENADDQEHSYVVTMDDITDLVLAQRDSAWGDVARRIAHEIKNPLTPIQLSAERLKRRYGRKLTEDREVFDQCTDTIVRQVSDIGRMVDEFSQFARMPKPRFEEADLREAVKEAVFLREVARPEIEFKAEIGDVPMITQLDMRLVSQAVGNVVKNAAESIEAVLDLDPSHKGLIHVQLSDQADHYEIRVTDNGKGLPEESRQRLFEPYMTTREKGTGLGLAIVRKIIEDHGGTIELTDNVNAPKGAMVTMTIAKTRTATDAAQDNSTTIRKPEDAHAD